MGRSVSERPQQQLHLLSREVTTGGPGKTAPCRALAVTGKTQSVSVTTPRGRTAVQPGSNEGVVRKCEATGGTGQKDEDFFCLLIIKKTARNLK
jgi:hypothetical protein